MALRWRDGGASASVDAMGTRKDRSDAVVAPPPPSKRLAQAVGSLEAEYAVLSEASAKRAALEAMLRNSQPLLWLDNALVLQREKPTAPATAKRAGSQPYSRPPLVASAPGGDVGGDELPWDDMLMESELRRRRRIQWEVAKRIARVEREISRHPVAQRSWHVREKKRLQEEEKRRQEELSAREKMERQQERDERLRVEKERKAMGGRAKREAAVANEPRETTTRREPSKVSTKPPPKVDVDLDFEWPSSPVKATSAQPAAREPKQEDVSESDRDNDKENAPMEALDSRMTTEVAPIVAKASVDPEAEKLMEIARTSLETPVPHAPSPSPQNETNVNFAGMLIDGDDDPDMDVRETQRRPYDGYRTGGRPDANTRNGSSLGRQVLSEYRTMSTPVSFGAPAVAGSRLNSDVLRRLFNDLDTDRDGHLNRIETCMALYRLHINVPAPRIVAFFKRIHTAEADMPRRNRNQRGNIPAKAHEPLKELINYKQFVAFVTTAFEQQQQQQSRHTHRLQDERREQAGHRQLALPPLKMPSQPEAPSPAPMPARLAREDVRSYDPQFHWPSVQIEEQERRLVEQDGDDETGDVADRVLRQIPDYIMARALAAADSPPRQVQQIVRRSLEKIGERKLEDAIVEDITRDLVRKYAQKLLGDRFNGGVLEEDLEDTSGLRRAAAYFDALNVSQLGRESAGVTNGEEDGIQDWWKVLTEEQVAGLVQEIWRQRQPSAAPAIPDEVQDEDESPTIGVSSSIQQDELEELVRGSNESADHVKATTNVQRVAEKSIQTGSIEYPASSTWHRSPSPPPPPPPPLSPPPQAVNMSVPPQHLMEQPRLRTTLAGAILSSRNPGSKIHSSEIPIESQTKHILADLRRQRRRRVATTPVAASVESINSADSLSTMDLPASTSKIRTIGDNTSHDVDSADHHTPIEAIEADVTTQPDQPVESLSSPLPVREVRVHPPIQSQIVPNGSVESSSQSFSNDVMSSYSSSLGNSMSLFQEIGGDDVWRYAAQRRRERLGHRGRRRTGPFSGHDSTDGDASLSEGEIVRDAGMDNLSDGELFGGTRRKIVRAKNVRTAGIRQSRQSSFGSEVAAQSVGGSLESGELLPSMITLHRNYQQRVIRSSASSLESGEAEDGVVVSIDVQDATDQVP